MLSGWSGELIAKVTTMHIWSYLMNAQVAAIVELFARMG